MSRGRVGVHVVRDERLIVLSLRDRSSGARASISLQIRGAAALGAQLSVATGSDTDDGWEAESELLGSLETHLGEIRA